jgi:phosphoribosylformylglycinamidine synthase
VPILYGGGTWKNDYYLNERKYSMPQTVLVTVVGKLSNVKKIVGSSFKNPGDIIYVLGSTRDELGGGDFYRLFNGIGNDHPQIFPDEHIGVYKALSNAIEEGLVESAHYVSDGGLAVAFAECAIRHNVGAELDLARIAKTTEDRVALLFSESAGRLIVSVKHENTPKFESLMQRAVCTKAGRVRGDRRFIIRSEQEQIINDSIDDMRAAHSRNLA